ncbi:MAG4940 family membrane protein [Mycoplasmoides gallisepticum]|uniref:MAG4940 family membrane protein n=1 Tax=Mycoplasmoides gallisepticum TaxID=2096 RepID=UPI003306920E
MMRSLNILTKTWDYGTAITEFGANFVLAFLIMFVFMIIRSKKIENRLVISSFFVFVVFISIISTWAWARVLMDSFPIVYLNPINVIFDAIVQMVNLQNSSNSHLTDSLKGLGYILPMQLVGILSGFVCFYIFYILITKSKQTYIKTVAFNQILFKTDNQKTVYFAFKDFIFILIYTAVIPMISLINPVASGLRRIDYLIVSMIVLFVIIYLSSFFEFYTFDILLSFAFAIFSTFFLLIDQNSDKQTIKTELKNTWLHFLISLIITLVIAIVLAIIVYQIFIQGQHRVTI